MPIDINNLCQKARSAASALACAATTTKNAALNAMADALCAHQDEILSANAIDVDAARKNGTSESLIDRLMLNPARIANMAAGLRQIASLPDPIGESLEGWRRPNGLDIQKVRVPMGVVGIIYESRPNVTADAAGLCLKSGNASILKGGSDALNSNRVIARILSDAASSADVPGACIQLLDSTDREDARALMRATGQVDVLIPRGGAGLIQSVIETATVPVIETGTGNCHTYVDASADLEQALAIVINAKCSRPSVCNAMETLLVHDVIAEDFLPQAANEFQSKGVHLRGCPRTLEIVPNAKPATEDDWSTEYLDLILAIRVVPSLDEAIAHINKYGTRHSEAIVTEDYTSAQRFIQEVDAAAVYVNASTRFTDGYEFGFGAEVGISNQKLHARGPMGLRELTTYKYIVHGNGQIRE